MNKTYSDQINQNTRNSMSVHINIFLIHGLLQKEILNYINAKQTFRKGQFMLKQTQGQTSPWSEDLSTYSSLV